MVFQLDTNDMDRHSTELRLYVDKARRRFIKANQLDSFETIVEKVLLQDKETADRDSLVIHDWGTEGQRRLTNYVMHLIGKCNDKEKLRLLQDTLRHCLGELVRREQIGCDAFCYFCTQKICPSSFDNMPITNGYMPTTSLPATLTDAQMPSGIPETPMSPQSPMPPSTNGHTANDYDHNAYTRTQPAGEVPMETNGFHDANSSFHKSAYQNNQMPLTIGYPNLMNAQANQQTPAEVPMDILVGASQQTPSPDDESSLQQQAEKIAQDKNEQMLIDEQEAMARQHLDNFQINGMYETNVKTIKLKMRRDSTSSDDSNAGTSTDSTASIKSLKKELISSSNSSASNQGIRQIKQEICSNSSVQTANVKTVKKQVQPKGVHEQQFISLQQQLKAQHQQRLALLQQKQQLKHHHQQQQQQQQQQQHQDNLSDSMLDSPRSRPLQIVTDSPSSSPHAREPQTQQPEHRRSQSLVANQQSTSQPAQNLANQTVGVHTPRSHAPRSKIIILTPTGPSMPQRKQTKKRRNLMKNNLS